MPSPNDWTTREFPIGIILNLTCSVQSLSHVQLCDPMDFSKPGFPVHHQRPELTQTHICQISDAIQPSRPLSSPLLPPSIFPSIRVFSSESALCITWPKYWSFSFSISPSNEYSGLIFFRIDWMISLLSKGLSRVFSNTTAQKHQFFSTQLSLQSDILECKVKWALGSITRNKASGGEGIPVELFQILKDDAVKVLHSISQQIWKTQQWPQDWKRSVFIQIPKEGNAKECSNYHTIALISHASKVMLKILQARLQ